MSRIWNKPEVPHSGWLYKGCVDLGNAVHQCEMCDQEEIRYVHYLSHPDYQKELAVGCVCAEKMVSEYVDVRGQQRLVQNRVKRKGTWIHKGWRVSEKGNEYKNNVLVFKKGPGWLLKINDQWGKKTYPNLEAAKSMAFDYLYPNKKSG